MRRFLKSWKKFAFDPINRLEAISLDAELTEKGVSDCKLYPVKTRNDGVHLFEVEIPAHKSSALNLLKPFVCIYKKYGGREKLDQRPQLICKWLYCKVGK